MARKIDMERAAEMARLYAEGNSPKCIGMLYDCSDVVVRAAVVAVGGNLRGRGRPSRKSKIVDTPKPEEPGVNTNA